MKSLRILIFIQFFTHLDSANSIEKDDSLVKLIPGMTAGLTNHIWSIHEWIGSRQYNYP